MRHRSHHYISRDTRCDGTDSSGLPAGHQGLGIDTFLHITCSSTPHTIFVDDDVRNEGKCGDHHDHISSQVHDLTSGVQQPRHPARDVGAAVWHAHELVKDAHTSKHPYGLDKRDNHRGDDYRDGAESEVSDLTKG